MAFLNDFMTSDRFESSAWFVRHLLEESLQHCITSQPLIFNQGILGCTSPRLKTEGACAFEVAASTQWSSLPLDLRSVDIKAAQDSLVNKLYLKFTFYNYKNVPLKYTMANNFDHLAAINTFQLFQAQPRNFSSNFMF